MSTRSLFFFGSLLATACSGASTDVGTDEPFRIRDAQFVEGDLPGTRVTNDATDAERPKPWVTNLGPKGGSQTAFVGQSGFTWNGAVTAEGVSVAGRIRDAGTGYWLLPSGAEQPGPSGSDVEYGWSAISDIGANLAPGYHDVEFVAFDAAGHPGTIATQAFCFESVVPDNLNACLPKKAPPYLVVSLEWDRPVDLDLHLVAPNGKVTDGKHPTTALPGASKSVDPNAPGVGVLQHDANAGCVVAGASREDVVFQSKPALGEYFVYANLFDACGESSVRFTVTLWQKKPGDEPGTFKQVAVYSTHSSMLAVSANGGTSLGLFVTEFPVQ